MYKLAPVATALALVLAAPTSVLADPGNGKGGEKQERGNRGGDEGRGDRGGGEARGAGRHQDRRADRPEARAQRAEQGPERRLAEAVRGRGGERGAADDRRSDAARPDAARPDVGRDVRRAVEQQVFQTRDGRPVVYFQRQRDRGLIAGCPPGLAKKDNGCLPPGQARQIARAVGVDRYESLWRRAGDDARYRYQDGYLYQTNSQGSLMGWLPVLGGALAPGAAWPSQYAYQPAPDYYSSYFGLPESQDYRYADGALYGVDPRTQRISQVAALLTGQNVSVGQPLPEGYDIYNVPTAYRDQYADSADAMYRYNDGYVYQADPKTQLVTAVIQLLT